LISTTLRGVPHAKAKPAETHVVKVGDPDVTSNGTSRFSDIDPGLVPGAPSALARVSTVGPAKDHGRPSSLFTDGMSEFDNDTDKLAMATHQV
jgi:hypothetical protein